MSEATDLSCVKKSVLDEHSTVPDETISGGKVTRRLEGRLSFTEETTEMFLEYGVEVEYVLDDVSISWKSWLDYLDQFEEGIMTIETATKLIHRHLMDVLETDDVFVRVTLEIESDGDSWMESSARQGGFHA